MIEVLNRILFDHVRIQYVLNLVAGVAAGPRVEIGHHEEFAAVVDVDASLLARGIPGQPTPHLVGAARGGTLRHIIARGPVESRANRIGADLVPEHPAAIPEEAD